jgi:hypothetical protein
LGINRSLAVILREVVDVWVSLSGYVLFAHIRESSPLSGWMASELNSSAEPRLMA